MIAVIDGFAPAGMRGREDERRTVLDLLQRVAGGGGGVVLAEGEPGIGKSVLVCLDDVQWTCPATLAALRTLPRALGRRPVAWVLARSGSCEPDAEHLFDVLERDAGGRIEAVPSASWPRPTRATSRSGRRPTPRGSGAGFATLACDGVTGRNRLADRIADGRA
jgi:hypothetical protein